MGGLGTRRALPIRVHRPERAVLRCTHCPGQDLPRLVRDLLHPPCVSDPLQGELPCRAQRRARCVFAWYYGSLDRPAPQQGHPAQTVRCRASSMSSLPSLPVPIRSWATPQLSALALRLVPQDPPRWPDWIIATATALSGAGASTENILDFFEIAVEEVNSADLLAAKRCASHCCAAIVVSHPQPPRIQMLQSLRDAVPLVTQAIASSLAPPLDPTRLGQLQSALRCFEAWIPNLPSRFVASACLFPFPLRSNTHRPAT